MAEDYNCCIVALLPDLTLQLPMTTGTMAQKVLPSGTPSGV